MWVACLAQRRTDNRQHPDEGAGCLWQYTGPFGMIDAIDQNTGQRPLPGSGPDPVIALPTGLTAHRGDTFMSPIPRTNPRLRALSGPLAPFKCCGCGFP